MASIDNKRSKSNKNAKGKKGSKSTNAIANETPSGSPEGEAKEQTAIVPAAQGDPTAKESSQTSSDSDRKIEYTSDKTILHLLLNYKNQKKLRYFKYYGDKIPENWAKKSARLRILLRQMRRVKWWFHFTRNNPNHTKRFYYRLKAIVGLENWDKIHPDIRQAWEDAANRFDVQFGLVRAWTMTPWVLETESTIPKNEPEWLSSLRKTITSQNTTLGELKELKNILSESPGRMKENLEKMKAAVSDVKETTEQIDKVLIAYRAIIDADTKQKKGEDSIS